MADAHILAILLAAVALLAVAAVLVLVARRRGKGTVSGGADAARPVPGVGTPPAAGPPAPSAAEIPSPFLPAPEGPPDDLRQIKGIGPKLEARLRELGVFHFRQIAAWTPEQLAIVDAELGPFQGRPERDRWQSQARFLAAGDIRGYEAAHGKLGPGS